MKNSIKSQIIALSVVLLSILILLFTQFFTARSLVISNSRTASHLLFAFVLIVCIAAIIYYIVMAKKKIIPLVVGIGAICTAAAVNATTTPEMFWMSFKMLPGVVHVQIFLDSGRFLASGIFLATVIIFIALLIALICDIRQAALSNPKKTVYVSNKNIYCGLAKHVLLLLFTCGIWLLIWIYRMTAYTNSAEGEDYRNPRNKLLLCMFVPFYQIFWTYKTAQRIDKMAQHTGIISELSTICLILAIFLPIIAPILMQDEVNAVIKATATNAGTEA